MTDGTYQIVCFAAECGQKTNRKRKIEMKCCHVVCRSYATLNKILRFGTNEM